ncbi:unnamed protein product [Meganyctiphanes norvegica]|uniref:Uncharacterized protein n=1 Tax=Meganyctiphanes norvegica TaxID=48144 RepID=A0AAV2RK53_MEGNR
MYMASHLYVFSCVLTNCTHVQNVCHNSCIGMASLLCVFSHDFSYQICMQTFYHNDCINWYGFSPECKVSRRLRIPFVVKLLAQTLQENMFLSVDLVWELSKLISLSIV